MYGRDYQGKTLNFEPSGGLIHAALVMQDKETDSYWSIMSGDALAGDLKGTPLHEMPVGVKTQWKDWVAEHPGTKVLSVGGVEHPERNPYDSYFSSSDGFRGTEAKDDRLPTKEPIYSFHRGGDAYAVTNAAVEGGAVLDIDGLEGFFYRPEGAAIFYSTLAFVSPAGFAKEDGRWMEKGSGARFDPDEGEFVGGSVERLEGFDTFWYSWSLQNPKSRILGK